MLNLEDVLSDEQSMHGQTSSDLDVQFDRAWAQEIFNRSLESLEQDWDARTELFRALRPQLDGSSDMVSYAAIAQRLELTEPSVKQAAFRLRKEFSAKVRAEIRKTVVSDQEVEEELKHLIHILRYDKP